MCWMPQQGSSNKNNDIKDNYKIPLAKDIIISKIINYWAICWYILHFYFYVSKYEGQSKFIPHKHILLAIFSVVHANSRKNYMTKQSNSRGSEADGLPNQRPWGATATTAASQWEIRHVLQVVMVPRAGFLCFSTLKHTSQPGHSLHHTCYTHHLHTSSHGVMLSNHEAMMHEQCPPHGSYQSMKKSLKLIK